MFTTIQGQEIEGEVIKKYEHTMIVLSKDGGTHLCKIVGRGQPIQIASLFDRNLDARYRRSRKPIACSLVYPDGSKKEFVSYKHAADHYGLKRDTIAKYVNSGNTISRGQFKGCRFERGV